MIDHAKPAPAPAPAPAPTAMAMVVYKTDYYGPLSVLSVVIGPMTTSEAGCYVRAMPHSEREPDYDPSVHGYRLGHGQSSPTTVEVVPVLATIQGGSDWSVLWDDGILREDEQASIAHLERDVDAHIGAATDLLKLRGVHVLGVDGDCNLYVVDEDGGLDLDDISGEAVA